MTQVDRSAYEEAKLRALRANLAEAEAEFARGDYVEWTPALRTHIQREARRWSPKDGNQTSMSALNKDNPMLRGDLIDLRPITADDLDTLEGWERDPDHGGEFNTFGLYRPGDIARAFAEHGYLADDRGMLLIVTKAGEAAGDVSYRTVVHGSGAANRVPEIGITIARPFRGRGFGAEAQRLLAAYLLATRPVARVQATTDIANIAEQRALERAGFTREGVLRRAQFRHSDWHDLVIYSKLRGE